MQGPTTEVLDTDFKSLTHAVRAIDLRLAKLDTQVSILIGLGGLLGVPVLMCFAYAMIWCGSINVEVASIHSDLKDLNGEVANIRVELKVIADKADANLRSLEGLARSLDRLDAKLDRMGKNAEAKPPATPGVANKPDQR